MFIPTRWCHMIEFITNIRSIREKSTVQQPQVYLRERQMVQPTHGKFLCLLWLLLFVCEGSAKPQTLSPSCFCHCLAVLMMELAISILR